MPVRHSNLLLLTALLRAALVFLPAHVVVADDVTGIVYLDRNENMARDPGEQGIPAVLVSNQRDVTVTDESGRYTLPLLPGRTLVFVIKPPEFDLPVDDRMLPEFFYIHDPEGSPDLRFGGISPTGPLPASVDFALRAGEREDRFDVLVLADPQPDDRQDIDFFRRDIVDELVNVDAAFGVTLGDMVWDDLSLIDPYNLAIAEIGLPFFNLPGNHDMDYDTPDDQNAMDTFSSVYGPPYYAFEYGQVSFIALDTVEWLGTFLQLETSDFRGSIDTRQLQWVQNYLAHVPEDRLIVFLSHIPLYYPLNMRDADNVTNRAELFALVENREHLLALAGHLHKISHVFLGPRNGWSGGAEFQQIICAAASGAWWSGPPDDRGIPLSIQQDGTPNGYHLISFDGNQYSESYRAAGEPASYQMRIYIADEPVRASRILADRAWINVFSGSDQTDVNAWLDGEIALRVRHVQRSDPFAARYFRENRTYFPLWTRPSATTHLWKIRLPGNLTIGRHVLRVTATDPSGRTLESVREFEVR